jgi:hypothetical protein
MTPLKRLYDSAQSELTRRLAALGPGSDKFTAHQLRTALGQIRQGQALMARRLAGGLGDLSRDAQVDALRGVIKDVSKLTRHFTGAEVVLPIEEAARFEGVITGRRESLLRSHATSSANIAARNITKAESALARSLLVGDSLADATEGVMGMMHEEWWQAERVARTECLSGDTLVSGAVVRAAHRRWYEGAVVEIITAGGRKFTATPNHPMLARRGWVPASGLADGDYLVCYDGEQHASSPGHQDVAYRPATIAEVFDTLSTVGVHQRRRTAQPDFHGDGLDGDVDTFGADRELTFGSFAAIDEPSAKQVFSPTDLTSAAFCRRCLLLLPINEESCLCDVPHGYSRQLQAVPHHLVAYVQSLGNVVRAFATPVPLDQLIIQDVGTVSWVRTPTLHERESSFRQRSCDAGISEGVHHPLLAGRHATCNLLRAEARDIKSDRVLSVRVRSFCGHVYNLSTPHGYFAIDGVYTGNTIWAYNATQTDGIRESAEEVPELMLRWVELVDDASGRPLDDRVDPDSLAMHGQVTEVGGVFTFPRAGAPGVKTPASTLARFAGMTWAHPPMRPNDRATVAPWAPSWGIPGWRCVGGRRISV